MPHDHYFSEDPAAADERRTMTVRLAGREVRVRTAPGVFSSARLDLGTQVLLRTVPSPPASGDLLDLGCGWGPIALSMAILSPGARVWAVDVNRRALDLVRSTATDLQLAGVCTATPVEVPPDVRFAAIWSNPPIRVGKAELHAMLATWLPRLTPDGVAHLVVQRNLGADSLQRWIDDALADVPGGPLRAERAASAKGFRVLRVQRPT